MRIAFPDPAGIERFHDAARELADHIDIDRVYESQYIGDEYMFGLTDPQHEAHRKALEGGYFDVPRRMDLNELGTALGISDTAASQRVRRGIKTLLEHTLPNDIDDKLSW